MLQSHILLVYLCVQADSKNVRVIISVSYFELAEIPFLIYILASSGAIRNGAIRNGHFEKRLKILNKVG